MGIDLGGLADAATGIVTGLAGAAIQNQTQAEIKEAQKNRPTYDVPTSIEAQLELLRRRSQQGLPGEAQIAGQIQQGTAQGVAASREASTSAADLLGATTNLYGQQTQSLMDLQIQSARQQASNELAYAQGLGTHAQYQDKAWNWNEATAWQTDMNRLMGISQSAYDLTTGGTSMLASGGSEMLSQIDTSGGSATNDYSGYSDGGTVNQNNPQLDRSQYQDWSKY